MPNAKAALQAFLWALPPRPDDPRRAAERLTGR